MNEFIVWDTENFISLSQAFKDEAVVVDLSDGFDSYTLDIGFENYSLHNYIGKTDIDGNKIYADCSIVEFEYMTNSFNSYKLRGYFKWNNMKLGYDLKIDNPMFMMTDFYIPSLDLKVIGTLQQDKHLLKDN